MTSHETYLRLAIEKSAESTQKGGFPAGAVIVKNDEVIGTGISIGNKLNDPSAHGEMASIRDACKHLGTASLEGATLYASMQPCIMCMSAAMWSGIEKAYYAIDMQSVDATYYGGTYNSAQINQTFLKPIELIQLPTLKAEAFKVVHAWEKALQAKKS